MTWFLFPLLLVGAPDKVARVIVYPDRAQVVRRQSVACGTHVAVTFGAIPPSIDPASLRAQSREAAVEGLRIEQHTRDEEYAPQVKRLDDEIEALEKDLAELRDAQAGENNANRLGERYANVATALIGREMSDAASNAHNWAVAFDVLIKDRLAATAHAVAGNAKARGLRQKLAELAQSRHRLASAAGRMEYVAEVHVSCPAGKSAQVELTYFLGGASWQPAYEARAQESSGRVELATFATVTQATGEDWKDAEIILSTAIPRQDATPPELAPLKVGAQERTPPRKVLTSHEEYRRHADLGGSGGQDKSGGRVGVAQQGLSVQLVVPEAADVLGDGTPARLLVGKHMMRATFRFRAAPKLMPFVFRTAELVNEAPFPLLPGSMDVFRRGEFLARYAIERVASGERFYLTFGLDERLRAERTIVEEVVRDQGILGKTRRRRYAYRFEVANYIGHPEEIELSEQIPVSELDDVKVEIDGKTTGGYELSAEDGIVRWRINLTSGERRTLNLLYHVDAPSSYDAGD